VAGIPDECWAEVARDTREALALVGRGTTARCLPGEPDHGGCGRTFAEHAGAHLAALKAAVDHELSHLGMPADHVSCIYRHELAQIEEGCGSHA
jgi:hypothetical protein